MAFLPEPPFTPLFPIYVPLTSINPMLAPEVASEQVLPLPRDIFGLPLRRDILHQCVVHHQSLLKQGSKHVLGRAEVKGSGKKLHRQKGTGKARVGDSGSGIRVGGGATFGPRKRDWSTQLPRKVRQLGLKLALSQKLREGKLWVVGEDGFFMEDWEVVIPRTHAFGPNSVDKVVLGASQPDHLKQQIQTLGLKKPLFLHSPFTPPPTYLLDTFQAIKDEAIRISNEPQALRVYETAPFSKDLDRSRKRPRFVADLRLEAISSVGTFDILKAHDVVCDKLSLEWLISTTRNYQVIEKMDLYSGNAMVMRRRSLGLSDFPKEGEVDESKEMLKRLEEEAMAGDGGPGGYELWREKALTDALEARDATKSERVGAEVEETLVEEEAEEEWEGEWEEEEVELTREEKEEIEESSRKLVDELKENPKGRK
ncbi:ribosomal protein L4/L1 family-domain-containing protein [Mrakia frigida]|uniref:mitochondrial 54S ribosomal protein uL4m YML6 n=1 Tax=Mrakia frigida TaxID=29902 RepID=UPI003FCBFA95